MHYTAFIAPAQRPATRCTARYGSALSLIITQTLTLTRRPCNRPRLRCCCRYQSHRISSEVQLRVLQIGHGVVSLSVFFASSSAAAAFSIPDIAARSRAILSVRDSFFFGAIRCFCCAERRGKTVTRVVRLGCFTLRRHRAGGRLCRMLLPMVWPLVLWTSVVCTWSRSQHLLPQLLSHNHIFALPGT